MANKCKIKFICDDEDWGKSCDYRKNLKSGIYKGCCKYLSDCGDCKSKAAQNHKLDKEVKKRKRASLSGDSF